MKIRLLALLSVLAVPALVSGQEFRGTISGTVTDPAGAAVAGAHITATETHTGTKILTDTNSGGSYTLPFLLPGEYTIAAETAGFKKFVRSGVQLDAGGHPTVDIQLVVGAVSESISVVEQIPLVNIVIFIIVWMGIAEARNKPGWWGILMLVPVVSLVVPGYLAWSD